METQENSKSGGVYSERKFLVFESKLLELFESCPVCSGPSQGSVEHISGTMVKIMHKCINNECSFRKVWFSQPCIRRMPVGNLLMSTSTLLSGTRMPIKCKDEKIICFITYIIYF